ncbi:putative mitochondrial inner membrane protease subunit Imp2 [Aspergillus lucknowensis]|uniref:Mitochondrial inner membrane protease subunit n=1 Tax=Aspergillus lucknowensis TaxID=176173 RepID=A0ABR4L9E0_9EURO
MPKPPRLRLSPDTQVRSSMRSRLPQPLTAPRIPPPSPTKSPKYLSLPRLRSLYARLPHPVRHTVHSVSRSLRVITPVLIIAAFFREHILQVRWVTGPSMTPYLNEDYANTHTERDVVLVEMWASGFSWPWSGGTASGEGRKKRRIERGMVVMFRSPSNPDNISIKRVIGLPGDRITTREPCLKESQIVPWNHVWLEGDAADPKNSMDSNTYGPVSICLILGRVFAVVSPRFRWLDWENWEKGVVDGDTEGRNGDKYREEVRKRVVKGAVQLELPYYGA